MAEAHSPALKSDDRLGDQRPAKDPITFIERNSLTRGNGFL